jgi:glutamine phosphoribosylpyrophosphate amidotransferase
MPLLFELGEQHTEVQQKCRCRITHVSTFLSVNTGMVFVFRCPNEVAPLTVGGMEENRRTTYKISEAARELGISAEWLREGDEGSVVGAQGTFSGRSRTPSLKSVDAAA